MTRVLLEGEAVEGPAPTIWRKDWTAIVAAVDEKTEWIKGF